MSATSLGNERRNPDELHTKSEVGFAEYEEPQENDDHQPGTCCGNCAEFIPDKNGHTWGACAAVEGYIAVEDWCSRWEHVSEEI